VTEPDDNRLGPLRQHLAPYRRLIVIVMVLQLVGTLASLYLPAADAAIIDDGVAKGNTATIVKLGAVMLAVTGLQMGFSVAAAQFAARVGMGFGRDLRSAVFERVTGLSPRQIARFGAASLLVRTTSDVQRMQALVQASCTMVITATITGVGGVFMAMRQDAGLSWVLLVAVPLLAVVIHRIASHILPSVRRVQEMFDSINQVMREQLSGIRVIRAFSREAFERDRFASVNDDLSKTTLAAGRGQALIQPVAMLVLNVSSVALVWFGGLRIGTGHMQAGSLIACVTYTMQILSAVLSVSLLLAQLPQVWVSVERVVEVLSATTDTTSHKSPTRRAALDGVIRFDNASFSYPGADQPVLRDLSFTALPGTTTAIVGSTGSGKSTLIGLICRLLDVTEGSVMLDSIDVRDYDTEQLRSVIGLVPQRAYLFSGTVADNLRFGNADATDAELWAALRIAAADGFVAAHPDGLRMPVAQGGINFSGGQLQRLAIARAVIRRPAVYLFDDAFSALDVHTQDDVWSSLRDISVDSTNIVVSQHISIAAQADQVIVIDNGTVVGTGTHESLLEGCLAYAEFARSQALTAAGWSR
jgi:ATP-binding cassette, subfamily B, multidrug efflux pump